jgi:hypothetical protein
VKPSHIAIVVATLICGAAPGRTLHAQPAGPAVALDGEDKPWNRGVALATRQEARELFLEGNRLFYIPLYTRAAEKYLAALEKWKHPAFYFNLALTQLSLGQEVVAHDNLKQAVQHGADPLGTLQFAEAEKQLEDLEHHLGRIRISCTTRGAEVTLDGTALFIAPGDHEVWVKPAAHEVIAKKPEYVTQVRRVAIAAGRLEQLALPMHKLIEDRPWAAWKPWVVVGSGAVIAASAGVLHALSARNFSAYDDGFRRLPCASAGCSDDAVRAMNPRLPALLSRAQLEQRLAIGGYVAGGALIAAGAALAYLNRPHLVEQGSEAAPAVAVVVSGNVIGIVVTAHH